MKKKLILISLMVALLACLLVIGVSAETPEQYIEFGARFPGSDEYITVYTQNAESTGNPQINFTSYKFYSDVEFTQEVDMSTVTGIDFSVAKTHGCNGNPPTRMKKPSSPFVNCEEVKWFLAGMPTVSYEGAFFKGWTGLKFFDFGNATGINDNTFEGCGFETITIPATITSIGGSAFKNCANLKSVKFEGDIKKFNNGATFYGCKALTSVEMENLTSIGTSMFESCEALTSVTIPNGVTSIGGNAFYNCKALASVSIPNGVTSIGSNAFRSTAITSVAIPSGVTTIGNEAFRQCGSLTSITIPSSVISVGTSAFLSCSALTEVVFEGDDTQLGTSMFNGCKNLASITLPKNLEKIPNSSFWGCGKVVITNISELANLTTIGASAFQDSMHLNFVLPDTVTTIEANAFQSAFKDGNGGSFVINKTSQLTTIGNSAFEDCRLMPASIYIPSTVTSIGAKAFLKCYTLQTLENFENCQITTIEDGTFSYVTALKTLKIPATVTTIGKAFDDNNNLTLVYIPKSVTSVANTFTGGKPANAVYIYTGKDASVFADCAKLAGAKVVKASEYDAAATYTGINLVVGYSHCVAYNGGVHGESVVDTIVTSYTQPIKVVNKCTLCEMTDESGRIAALFTYRGFSTQEKGGNSIVIGFTSNSAAISEYEEIAGKTLAYGVFAVSQKKLGDSLIFGENGAVASGVINADLTNSDFAMFDLKLTGFTADNMDNKLAMGAYVIATDENGTEYSYLQDSTKGALDGKYYFASYNDILGI